MTQIAPPVKPEAFKRWERELTDGAKRGEPNHALVLIGNTAAGLINSIYTPTFLREPYTKRQVCAAYSEAILQPSQLPTDCHMLVIHVEDINVLARDSRLVEQALLVVRAIVFLVPDRDGSAFATTAARRLGLGNRLRPCYLVVTPGDMCGVGGLHADQDKNAETLPSAQDLTAPVAVVKASAGNGELAALRWQLAQLNAARRLHAARNGLPN